MKFRIGTGYDAHRFCDGRGLVLCGVEFPGERGLAGHSDADAPLHALTDALLGALALGDIGKLFPDTDDAYLGADSRALLREVVGRVNAAGFVVGNIDATVLAQAPKLRPFIDEMRANIAADCRVDVSRVNVKATTEEGLGFTGEGLGMAAHAVCILEEGSEDEC